MSLIEEFERLLDKNESSKEFLLSLKIDGDYKDYKGIFKAKSKTDDGICQILIVSKYILVAYTSTNTPEVYDKKSNDAKRKIVSLCKKYDFNLDSILKNLQDFEYINLDTKCKARATKYVKINEKNEVEYFRKINLSESHDLLTEKELNEKFKGRNIYEVTLVKNRDSDTYTVLKNWGVYAIQDAIKQNKNY